MQISPLRVKSRLELHTQSETVMAPREMDRMITQALTAAAIALVSSWFLRQKDGWRQQGDSRLLYSISHYYTEASTVTLWQVICLNSLNNLKTKLDVGHGCCVRQNRPRFSSVLYRITGEGLSLIWTLLFSLPQCFWQSEPSVEHITIDSSVQYAGSLSVNAHPHCHSSATLASLPSAVEWQPYLIGPSNLLLY